MLRVQDSWARFQGAGFRIHGPGSRVQGSGFMGQVPGCRVQDSWARFQGAGFRIHGPGFRVQGSGKSDVPSLLAWYLGVEKHVVFAPCPPPPLSPLPRPLLPSSHLLRKRRNVRRCEQRGQAGCHLPPYEAVPLVHQGTRRKARGMGGMGGAIPRRRLHLLAIHQAEDARVQLPQAGRRWAHPTRHLHLLQILCGSPAPEEPGATGVGRGEARAALFPLACQLLPMARKAELPPCLTGPGAHACWKAGLLRVRLRVGPAHAQLHGRGCGGNVCEVQGLLLCLGERPGGGGLRAGEAPLGGEDAGRGGGGAGGEG